MPIAFTNTMGRVKQIFKPVRGKTVRMYTCGPTVYDYAHIGNFRAYIFEDLLRRFLRFKGYKVKQVMNLTDVDDKTILGAHEKGVGLATFTDRYIRAFFEDLDRLNIERAEHYPRATEHIGEMVELIKKLRRGGYAYSGEDGSVYYDVSKFPEYGKLSGIKLEQQRTGLRVRTDEYTKDEATDFALWKSWDEGDGDAFWETELGKGRPGWHIECSAMSMKYLGDTFEIHAGGEDNIFPHHENEIAQSTAATGKPFVKYWLHCGLLQVEGKKMSKSLGNHIVPRILIEQGHDPRAIRYFLLAAHYRAALNFTQEALAAAENTVQSLDDFMHRISQLEVRGVHNKKLYRITRSTSREFTRALEDDLDTPRALAAIHNLMRETNRALDQRKISRRNLEEVYAEMVRFDSVLAVIQHRKQSLEPDLLRLIRQREDAREKRDWKLADELRSQLLVKGIALEDTPYGVIWKQAK
jgi:cysteinyl-tRNA synthetase